jgi:crotonobetainyl-CoA:carnitine CoA-transferase CaiB-like acyl-CoA transferase
VTDYFHGRLSILRSFASGQAELDGEVIVKILGDAGVPCDIVQKPEDLLHDKQAIETEVMVSADVTGFGRLQFPGIPLSFNGQRPQVRFPLPAD